MVQNPILLDRNTEMAWYVLNQFINPLDCSAKYMGAALPMNNNAELARVFNHERDEQGCFCRPYYFSKLRLHSHLNGGDTYYYRCRYNAVARMGYGSYDAAKDKLGFADALGIDGRVRKFPKVGIMLLCADVDAHNGEQDVEKVRDFLLAVFPASYWERSTNGKGIHFYFKLAYPRDFAGNAFQTLRYVHRVMTEYAVMLDRRRKDLGYDAPIDGIRGLPSLIGCDSNGRIRIENRSRCIKIPRFEEGERAIRMLHEAPYVLFGAIDEEVKQQKAADLLATREAKLALSKAMLELFEQEPESFIPDDGEEGADLLHSNSVVSKGCDQLLQDLRQERDAYERGLRFAFAYTRHCREVPSVEDLLAEYEYQQLNTLADDDGNRRKRFTFFHEYIARTFDRSRLGFTYEGFAAAQPEVEAFVQRHLTPSINLSRPHKKSSGISLEELGRAFYAILKSQGEGTSTAFSINQMRQAFKTMTGTGVGKRKAIALFKLLRDMGLIERISGYIPGVRGLVWRVEKLPPSDARAA